MVCVHRGAPKCIHINCWVFERMREGSILKFYSEIQYFYGAIIACPKTTSRPRRGWGTTPSKFGGTGLPWNWFVVVKEQQQTFNSVSCILHHNKYFHNEARAITCKLFFAGKWGKITLPARNYTPSSPIWPKVGPSL